MFGSPNADMETSLCPSPRVCIPEVLPPIVSDCEVEHPLLRRCEHRWQVPLIADAIRCPQSLCFQDVKRDKLDTVAMVSTLDILRAIGR